VGADFVWRMEDVLDLYAESADPERPLVCFDELPVVLRSDVRAGALCAPGEPARVDYEYTREGTANCFLSFAPHLGWRHVDVTERRAAVDFAHCMRALVDEHFPRAERIRVVLDNLSTHTLASLYQAFAPEDARRLTEKLEFHYTPKHASWLNMAEIELSVLDRQCLERRLASIERLSSEVGAWEQARNAARVKVIWRFTTHQARMKLARLYPEYAA